jgi:hypothetical protein
MYFVQLRIARHEQEEQFTFLDGEVDALEGDVFAGAG